MPHTHLNHQGHHHAGHQHHPAHHEVKRGMETKTILWVIGVVIAVAVIAAFIFIPKVSLPEGESAAASEQCALFCNTNQRDAFCSFNVIVNDNLRTTCQDLATNSAYSQYNVQPCSTISCQLTAQELDKTCVTGLKSTWVTPTAGGCPAQDGKFTRIRSSSDNPPIEGQICCYYYE